jgi:Tfp pilus assembly protein FimT
MVELMTVVAIITLVAAVAIPNYMTSMARARLKDAVTELHGNLNMARMAAMNRNTTVTVTLAVVNGRVTATFTNPNNTSANCLASTGLCVLPTQTMSNEVASIAGLLGGTSQVLPLAINFNSLGLLVGTGTNIQTVRLTNTKGITFEIQITPAGKSRWCNTSPCP